MGRSFTGVLFDAFAALIARDVAAPMELALALEHARVLVRVVAAAAAQQVAPISSCINQSALINHRHLTR